MYVCLYVCMYVRMYVCMFRPQRRRSYQALPLLARRRLARCVLKKMYACTYVCLDVCMYMYVWMWMYEFMYVCIYVCMHDHACINYVDT